MKDKTEKPSIIKYFIRGWKKLKLRKKVALKEYFVGSKERFKSKGFKEK